MSRRSGFVIHIVKDPDKIHSGREELLNRHHPSQPTGPVSDEMMGILSSSVSSSSSVTCPLRRESSLSSSGSSCQTTSGEWFSSSPPPCSTRTSCKLCRVHSCTRPDFFTLYLEEPDKAGHSYGPNGDGVSPITHSQTGADDKTSVWVHLLSEVRRTSEEHLPVTLPLI